MNSKEKHYFVVVAYEDNKQVRQCGHKHKTLSSAYNCMSKLKDYRNGTAKQWVMADVVRR